MGCLSLVARRYSDIVERFGVHREACQVGHLTLVATTAPVGVEALASLSELALALVGASVRDDDRFAPPAKLRIGLVVVAEVWHGWLRALAQARPCGRGWLLDCELQDEQGRLLSTAYGALAE
jgi:hypothetical protein